MEAKMNVLLLEDRGASGYYISECLRQEGHIILDAYTPAGAQALWDNREEIPINCIILDLHLPSDGLNEDQLNRTEGGILCGWVWLKENILSMNPEMRQRTIIYSIHSSILKEKTPRKDYLGISVFSKTNSGSGNEILARIRQIAKI